MGPGRDRGGKSDVACAGATEPWSWKPWVGRPPGRTVRRIARVGESYRDVAGQR
jgi:hypothetical protein